MRVTRPLEDEGRVVPGEAPGEDEGGAQIRRTHVADD
jgi:hypothetical protein